ncbi:MAG: sigma-70 family RNA polymerase sigma factor [Fimbriimonas ginsengisoli]|uniref:Sigma-70 family RNA polymerase sigma factor n=1 Tax=Fimbriimonas ginsengisoli TaxID=1005039 RepID=A0A931PST4_FIMGI|nr:sigma-70 family RNA polymerase sigma factor [Fimbriimonas ginsengisoli]
MSTPENWNLHQDAESLVLRYLDDPRPDLKDVIIVQYASLVERTARKFSGIEPFEDLVQVGFIGLLNALTKFDPNAGVRFNTYATYLVAGEIKHYLRDRAQTIRHPAWLQELRHKVGRATSALQQTLGRAPTSREVADDLGISESSVQEIFQTQETLKVASLDAPVPGEDEMGEVDKLDAAAFCPEQLTVEDRVLLEQALKQLRDLERQVLMHFHFDAMNQTEIAAKLGISCNYVSHILRQSLTKLRKILTAEEEKDRLLRRQVSSVDYDVIDTATGSYTEGYFHARLREELHRASSDGSGVALVMLRFSGLDRMQKFYGEQSVQEFLADAAEFLKDNVRRLDAVSRYGETGFAIILPSTTANVELVRQRLISKSERWMSGRFSGDGILLEIGQSFYPVDARTAHEMVEAAQLRPIGTPAKRAA